MALSALPTDGPTLPAGAQKVSIKRVDLASSTNKAKNEDVTVLGDTERKYAAPPLVEPSDGAASGQATATCQASGLLKGSEPEPTPITTKTGWICEDTEVVYEAGKYATWSANYSYYPSSGS